MNFLTRFSAAVFKNLTLHLDSLSESAERATVHHFRVEVKRLRALLYLVNSMHQKEELNEPEFLDKIFKAAGRLREVQLEGKWFQRGNTEKDVEALGWVELLQRKEQRNKEKLKKAVQEVNREKLECFNEKLDGRLMQLNPWSTVDFLFLQYAGLRERHQNERLKRGNLHDLRKKLKEMSYVMEAMDGSGMKLAWNENTRAQLLKVLDTLGKWHDAAIAITHLKDSQDDLKSVFPRIYKKLNDDYRRKYNKQYKKARETAANLLSQDLILT